MKISQIKNKTKPKENQAAYESNQIEMISNINSYSFDNYIGLSGLVYAIESGQTIVYDEMNEGKRCGSNSIGSYFVAIDIDTFILNSTMDESIRSLMVLDLKPYLIYKTFGYTDVLQKHRIIFRFDEMLSKHDLQLFYIYLSQTLDIDVSTMAKASNFARLVYGTNIKIAEEYKVGHISSKSETFKMIPKDINSKVTTFNAEVDFVEFEVTNIKDEKFDEVMNQYIPIIQTWPSDSHDLIRRTIYSCCLILDTSNKDNKYFNAFIYVLNQYQPHRVNKWLANHKSDMKSNKFHYKEGRELALKIATLQTKDITKVFDILNFELNDLEKMEENTYIDYQKLHKASMTFKNILLLAPAGSGKTTAILNIASTFEDKDGQDHTTPQIVLIVPTQAIVMQLEIEYEKAIQDYTNFYKYPFAYRLNDTVFLYDQSNSRYNKDARFIVSTYDKYVRVDNEHLLFIDEAHEFVSYNDFKHRKIKSCLETAYRYAKSITYVTASPLNLADEFDQKIIYTRPVNKKVFLMTTKNSPAHAVIPFLSTAKSLILLNSQKKALKLIEKIKQDDPNLKVTFISSNNKNKEYINILNNAAVENDVVITTKILNTGVNITNKFTNIFYAENKINPNDVLQLLNREREEANFFIFSKEMVTNRHLVNSAYAKNINILDKTHLSERDKELLDTCRVNEKVDPHLFTNRMIYNQMTLSIEDMVKILEKLVIDFKFVQMYEQKVIKEDKIKKIPVKDFFLDESNHDFIESSLNDYLQVFRLNKTGISNAIDKKLKTTFNIYRIHDEQLIERGICEVDNDGIIAIKDMKSFYYLTSEVFIPKFDDANLNSLLSELSTINHGLRADELDEYAKKANEYSLFNNNEVMDRTKLMKYLRTIGLMYEPSTTKINGKNVRTMKNKSIFLTKPIQT